MRQIRALTVVLIAMLLVMALPPVSRAQRNQPPFDTVVAETPWGSTWFPPSIPTSRFNSTST
jgi:hypothetical protein